MPADLIPLWPYFFVYLAFCVVCIVADDWMERQDQRARRITECPDVPRAGDSTTSAPQG